MPQRNNADYILLHKATKARQTSGRCAPKLQLCIEPLLSKLPLSRIFDPAACGVFFAR